MDKLSELRRVAKAALCAADRKGGSVECQNPDVVDQAADCLNKETNVILFGVKNTDQIRRQYVRRLTEEGRYVWHTVDAAAEGGRAVEMRFINPLTGKPMTGSSGATAIHVLLGINDVGIGTDGGGSLLAPALSLNLCSVMGKGIGLVGSSSRRSTDGIAFVPGIGAISHSLLSAAKSVLLMAGINPARMTAVSLGGRKAAIPASGLILPDGSDMRERLVPALNVLEENGIKTDEQTLPDCMNRRQSMDRLLGLLADHDVVISYEGPVDIYGLGDSVFGGWGPNAAESQTISGKYLVKIANMVNATAITIPAGDAAAGIVVLAREGIEPGLAAITLSLKLAAAFPPPAVFDTYFRNGWQRRASDLLFSLRD